jgi:hypothetical protein
MTKIKNYNVAVLLQSCLHFLVITSFKAMNRDFSQFFIFEIKQKQKTAIKPNN